LLGASEEGVDPIETQIGGGLGVAGIRTAPSIAAGTFGARVLSPPIFPVHAFPAWTFCGLRGIGDARHGLGLQAIARFSGLGFAAL
jgi:hypothetical protein